VLSHRPFAVLLDLDGTLLDTVDLILASVRYAFEEHRGPRPSDADWIAGIGKPMQSQMKAFAAGPGDLAHLIARYREYYRAHDEEMTRRFPNALEVTRLLKDRGHPIAVVTSKVADFTRTALERCGLAAWIDVCVTSDSCPRHKPDPMPVRLALEQLGREPSEALFVGDSPHDIAAGNAAGVTSVAALWGVAPRAELEGAHPRFLLESLQDLPALVESVQGAAGKA
jgi:pyrophosphatase PpaX